MTRHVRSTLLCAIALLLPVALQAQDASPQASGAAAAKDNTLTIDLNMLSHGEMRNGGLISETSEEGFDNKSRFLMGRERLIIDYRRTGLQTHLNIQHSGLWGQSGKGAFNIYEAWAKLDRYGLFAQIGRIALAYDDQRIIGPNDWSMASLSHDVLRLGYEGHGHKAHVILAYNQNAEAYTIGGNYYANGAQPYKSMQTVWYHYDVPRLPLGVSVLFMNIGMQGGEKDLNPHTETQQLLGSYVTYRPKYWIIEGSYYHQFGKDEGGLDIDAWMASTKVDWSPSTKWGMYVGFDYLSGDEKFAVPPFGSIGYTYHGTIHGFNPIYGSHHKFYGAMDFFYVSTYVGGFTPGLQNTYLGLRVSPIKALTLNATYHYLATATKLTDMSRKLGHEFELQAKYVIAKDISLSVGYSHMTGTETMDRLKRANGDGSLRWGWFSLIVNPRIFSTKL